MGITIVDAKCIHSVNVQLHGTNVLANSVKMEEVAGMDVISHADFECSLLMDSSNFSDSSQISMRTN